MKILCIIPPHVPSYFNAGHHLPIFLMAAYLRNYFPGFEIKACDFSVLNATWKDVCDLLIHKFDIIFTLFDYDGADSCERFSYYVKSISSASRLVAFGRLVKEIPYFFIKRGYQAAHAYGDYECGARNYIEWILGKRPQLSGLIMGESELIKTPSEDWLQPEHWVLPDVNEIPYSAYNNLYKNDLNKFCGIPARQELVVPVARGCSVGCFYCDVPAMQGLKERRVSVDDTLRYIKESFEALPFEYFTFYAPTFTLNKQWVIEFCNKKCLMNLDYKWKCVTVLKTLTEELLCLMAKAGCVRVSFGIESFDEQGALKLPKIKQNALDHFKKICQIAKQLNVEINVFLIMGLPGDTPQSMHKTMQMCLEQGIRIRPTIFTPYDRLNNEMSLLEVSSFNRQIFIPGLNQESDNSQFYELFYKNDQDKATTVMQNIPEKI